MHDDVIKPKHFPLCWPFVLGIHLLPVDSPHKGLWRGALMFYLICAWIIAWVNNREAGDLRRHRAHYDVTVMDTSHGREARSIYLPISCPCTYIPTHPHVNIHSNDIPVYVYIYIYIYSFHGSNMCVIFVMFHSYTAVSFTWFHPRMTNFRHSMLIAGL